MGSVTMSPFAVTLCSSLPAQVVINPNYEVAESDYSNNVMKCRSRYDGQRIWMYNCHIGESPCAGNAGIPPQHWLLPRTSLCFHGKVFMCWFITL